MYCFETCSFCAVPLSSCTNISIYVRTMWHTITLDTIKRTCAYTVAYHGAYHIQTSTSTACDVFTHARTFLHPKACVTISHVRLVLWHTLARDISIKSIILGLNKKISRRRDMEYCIFCWDMKTFFNNKDSFLCAVKITRGTRAWLQLYMNVLYAVRITKKWILSNQ